MCTMKLHSVSLKTVKLKLTVIINFNTFLLYSRDVVISTKCSGFHVLKALKLKNSASFSNWNIPFNKYFSTQQAYLYFLYNLIYKHLLK